MEMSSLFSIAFRALWRNWSRSLLTMLGVIIGVTAVILLIAIGNGLQASVVEQFDNLGVNNIFIAPGDVFGEGGGFGGEDQLLAMANNKITYDQVREIRRLRDTINLVTGLSVNVAEASYKGEKLKATIAGADESYFLVTNTTPAIGQPFTESQNAKQSKVAFLGSAVAVDLFGDIDPVGKTVVINNQSYEVIGVGEEKGGGFGGPSFDDYIYIPIQTWFELFDSRVVFRIIAQAKSAELLPLGIIEIERTLGKNFKDDEFSVFEQKEILGIIDQILGALTAGLGGIAAISLLVGGIGIMNIMLVSVTERTREIGLRKALGATPRLIRLQFLIEAVTLSVVGGLVGVSIAFGASLLIRPYFPALVTMNAVGLAFGVSVVVGVVFGVYPANRASKLSPIEALRYE